MALDGLTVFSMEQELNKYILNGKIDKIYQPETDEIILNIRKNNQSYKLLMTSHSTNARIHLTNIKRNNPLQPPMFCMLLRKHLTGGKIISIKQINFDRILKISIENTNEMGDLCTKFIYIEIMGKHSNIIVTNENNVIMDSIKHVTSMMSKVREVLPGLDYIFPPSKCNPLLIEQKDFINNLYKFSNQPIYKNIYKTFNGISPIIAKELCFISCIECDAQISNLNDDKLNTLYSSFNKIISKLNDNNFNYQIIYDENDEAIDFSPIELSIYSKQNKKKYDMLSETMEDFYLEKDINTRIKQKSHDLLKLIQTNLDRCIKKQNLQHKQLKDTENRDKYKLHGELLTANIYALNKGMTSFTTVNFYDPKQSNIEIPLNPNLTPSENAQKYFNKYNKYKRTSIALVEQLKETKKEIDYLQTILNSLEISSTEQDIYQIREELYKQGYIKKLKKPKKATTSSKQGKFVSSEGSKILVGKNNIQNDELTFKIASSRDLWFHVKNMPGSHVILFTDKDFTDQSIIEAANIAAYHSKGKMSSKVPVDYTYRRFVKKPNGSKPGFVIYTNQKTLYVTPIKKEIESKRIK